MMGNARTDKFSGSSSMRMLRNLYMKRWELRKLIHFYEDTQEMVFGEFLVQTSLNV